MTRAVFIIAAVASVVASCAVARAETGQQIQCGDVPTIEGAFTIDQLPRLMAVSFKRRGDELIREKKYDQAIACFNTAIEAKPDYDGAYNDRGLAYKFKEDYDRAIADFSKAIELKPNQAAYYVNRGNCYRAKTLFDLSIKDHTKAIELDPTLAAAYNGRCYAKAQAGQAQAAIPDCDKAVELAPGAEVLESRGYAYFRLGNLQQAIANYDQALAIDPTFPEALFGRGVAKRRLGQTASGDLDIAAARKGEPRIDEIMAKLGITP